jgi:hypothetical protein
LRPSIRTVEPTGPYSGVKDRIVGKLVKTKPDLVPVPYELVTATEPDEPPATTAVITVSFNTLNEPAEVPPKLTVVEPVKYRPFMVTIVPGPPIAGVKLKICGIGKEKKKTFNESVPNAAVVTFTEPVAPVLTTAVMLVSPDCVYEAAETPPKYTPVVPVKLKPLIVTGVPIVPDDGLKLFIVTALYPRAFAVPFGVLTIITPDEPGATVAVRVSGETTLKDVTGTPPIVIDVVPVKLLPFIVKIVPPPPDKGEKELITGPVCINPGA